jgi:hypothetical protein
MHSNSSAIVRCNCNVATAAVTATPQRALTATLQQQRCTNNNVAVIATPQQQQRCELQCHRCCSIASNNDAIAVTLVHPTFVGLLSNDSFKPCRPASCAMSSYVLFCHLAFSSNICLTSVQPLFDLRWTSV